MMPVYNGEQFLAESLGSVLAQTEPRWELLIGVNGHASTSPVYTHVLTTVAALVAPDDDRVRVWCLDTPKGKCHALNALVPRCRYDRVALLDVDDAWRPDKLAAQWPFLFGDPHDYDVVGTQTVYVAPDRPALHGRSPTVPTGAFDGSVERAWTANPIVNSSAVLRARDAWWDPTREGVEDYDLWLRLRPTASFYTCAAPLTLHRVHAASAFNARGNHRLAAAVRLLHAHAHAHAHPMRGAQVGGRLGHAGARLDHRRAEPARRVARDAAGGGVDVQDLAQVRAPPTERAVGDDVVATRAHEEQLLPVGPPV